MWVNKCVRLSWKFCEHLTDTTRCTGVGGKLRLTPAHDRSLPYYSTIMKCNVVERSQNTPHNCTRIIHKLKNVFSASQLNICKRFYKPEHTPQRLVITSLSDSKQKLQKCHYTYEWNLLSSCNLTATCNKNNSKVLSIIKISLRIFLIHKIKTLW